MTDFNYATYLADILVDGLDEERLNISDNAIRDLDAVFQAVPDELKGPVFGAFRAELVHRGIDESLLDLQGGPTVQ